MIIFFILIQEKTSTLDAIFGEYIETPIAKYYFPAMFRMQNVEKKKVVKYIYR